MRNLISALVLSIASLGAQAATVLPNGSLLDLGLFGPGSYRLTASGTIDLCGDSSFTMGPDGRPVSSVTCGHYGSVFNPDGSYIADGTTGRAGMNAKIGALIGTFNANAYTGNNPNAAQADDWFLIGFDKTINLTQAGHIYASVNDTYHPNNIGAFQVNVQAVPEAQTWAMMAGGLACLAAFARRRKAA
ncbi:PEP-CTERM sorting domain-containing protein [Massilia sp. W12]|uniref:PEP-CTERM sorting domain-containing protein n=1 Tax=Massilia sp. W12 TaxID=3126507 RepID=UPI0030D4BCD5